MPPTRGVALPEAVKLFARQPCGCEAAALARERQARGPIAPAASQASPPTHAPPASPGRWAAGWQAWKDPSGTEQTVAGLGGAATGAQRPS